MNLEVDVKDLNGIGNMTLYEFLMQSPKQIQAAFREKDWFDTYHKVPLDIPSWCKCFGLEMDPRITYYGNCRSVYFHIDEEIPGSWFGHIEYELSLSVTGRNHKIVVHFLGFSCAHSSSDSPDVGSDKYVPGFDPVKDERDACYYNLGFDIEPAMFSDGYKEKGDYKFYTWKDGTPIKEYHDRLLKIVKDIEPYFKEVYDSFHSGLFKKLWKKYYTRELRNGDMTNDGFGVGLRGLVCIMYYGEKILGRKTSLEEAIALSSLTYNNGSIFRDKEPKKDEKLIDSIMFYSRGGFFNEDLKTVTLEWFEAQIKKVIK